MARWRKAGRRDSRCEVSASHRRALALAVAGAVLVALVVPASADREAAAQEACGPSSVITGVTGTVADAVSAAPVPGAIVAVLRTSDHAVVGGALSGGDGRFTIAVAAGDYQLYVAASTPSHVAQMQPGTVTVANGSLTTVHPSLAPTRGSLSGSIIDDVTADAVGGGWAIAIDVTTGAPVRAAVADGSGAFRIDGLRGGPHLVAYVDPSGRHGVEYSGNVPSPAGATPVTVAAGDDRQAGAGLTPRPTTPASTAIQGTLSETGGRALPGMMVVALRSGDLSLVAGALSDADGRYQVDLPPGDYKLGVIDPTGAHPMIWHDGRRHDALATASTISTPAAIDPVLPLASGAVTGSIVDDPTGAPLACIWVVAIAPDGAIAGVAATGADGRYRIEGLAPGTHRLTLVDPSGSRPQEYWENSVAYAGATPVTVRAGEVAVADGDLAAATPFGAPNQWVARQYTELLGRPPSPAEWRIWTDYYGAQTACTAAALNVLPMYLTGLTTPPVPGLPAGTATEFTSRYPDTSQLDRALRAAAVIRAAYGHDANDNDWNSRIKPYVLGTSTWSATVNGLYGFIMAFVGPGTFCRLDSAAYPFSFSRALDLRANVTALTPSQPLPASRTQAQLEADLAAASLGSTVAQRTVTLREGEVVRVGGSANGNRPLVVPAGVTLTSAGLPTYTEDPNGTPSSLAYGRMGRIVPATTAGSPGFSPVDGVVCEASRCNNIGLVTLAPGADLVGVWVDGMGLSDANYKVALVRTTGSAADTSSTPYDDRTSVVANRLSEPTRDGVGLRLEGASTGAACIGQQALGNLVTGYSSRHQFDQRGQAQWVDGITVACEDATVAGNGVVDVTDVGILVQGSVDRAALVTRQRSDVRANTVLSAGLDAHVALGADAIGTCQPIGVNDAAGAAKPAGPVPCLDLDAPRDFTGARMRDNRFLTGSRTSFDVGLMVGGGAMWGDHRVTNQGPDAAHPDAEGIEVTGNSTGGMAARVNIGIDVHDMTDATVTGNTTAFRLVDGNPRVTWSTCPESALIGGGEEVASLTTDAAFTVDDRSRGCVVGAPPAAGLELLELSPDGSAFVGSETGSTLRVWGGDLDVDHEPDQDIVTWVDDFRDVRRMGVNVIRLLLDTEDYVDEPACPTCEPTADAAAVAHLGDIALAAEEVGLYLDITGNGISYHHHRGTWFDELDASPGAELVRWRAQEVFWEAVAAELRPRTSVAWYDLINEPTMGAPASTWCFTADMAPEEPCWNPNIVKSLTDPADPSRQRTRLEVARAWTERMRDAIKVGAGDTVHPVSVGQLSFCGGPLNQASRELADFDMVHMYPEDATLTADVNTVNNCKQPGRTLLVEETYLTASLENLELFFERTEARTAGYVGHVLGGTPVQVLDWIQTHSAEEEPGPFWAHVFWYVWDQFALREVALRNPTGPGIMPS